MKWENSSCMLNWNDTDGCTSQSRSTWSSSTSTRSAIKRQYTGENSVSTAWRTTASGNELTLTSPHAFPLLVLTPILLLPLLFTTSPVAPPSTPNSPNSGMSHPLMLHKINSYHRIPFLFHLIDEKGSARPVLTPVPLVGKMTITPTNVWST